MATTYLSPGVYVEEVDKGTKPIQVLGASMPAFLGITAQASHKFPGTGAPDPDRLVLGKATLVTNWTQFQTIFGGFVKGAFLPDAIYGYFNNGGGPCYVTSLRALHEDHSEEATKASFAVPAESATPSSRTSKTRSKKDDEGAEEPPAPAPSNQAAFTVEAKVGGRYGRDIRLFIDRQRDKEGKPGDTFTMRVRYPTTFGMQEETATELKIENNKIINPNSRDSDGQPQEVQFDSINITNVKDKLPAENPLNAKGNPAPYQLQIEDDSPEEVLQPLSQEEIIGNIATRLGLGGLEVYDDIRLLVCPDLMAGVASGVPVGDAKNRIIAIQKAMQAHCQKLKYRFAILDTPPGLDAQQVKEWREDLGIDSSYCALYYPWLEVPDMSGGNGKTKFVPPSGYMAGIYNRVDGERGVHKAPANEAPMGIVGLERDLTKGEQDTLNPWGINCLRKFPGGRGVKVWGARTLSTEGAWRYINVRRLFITVAASLDEGLQWVVFEPNDRMLWARVRRDIRAFLSTFWLNGALFGSTQDEAFYVKCDDELNPPAIRDLGQLIIEVGLCPVKPAEFVILRLSQWAGPNAESE